MQFLLTAVISSIENWPMAPQHSPNISQQYGSKGDLGISFMFIGREEFLLRRIS
jgi:hypothetical protein